MSIVVTKVRAVGLFAATVLAIASIMFWIASVQHPNRAIELVPSSVGTYWIYKGDSREQIGKKIEDRTWHSKQTVIDSIKSGGVSASLVEEDTQMQMSVRDTTQSHSTCIRLVFDNNRYYEEYDGEQAIRDTWRTLKDKIAAGERPAEPDQDWLQIKVPPSPGSIRDPSVAGNEGNDSWCVEKVVPLKSETQVGKFSIPQETTEYSIAFRTASEDTTRKFVSGIGFTARSYAAHAKIKFTDEQLVEFHPTNQ